MESNEAIPVVVTPKERFKSITHLGNIIGIVILLFTDEQAIRLITDLLSDYISPVKVMKIIAIIGLIFNIYRREVTTSPIKGSVGEKNLTNVETS